VTVGLPGRGKTFAARSLSRYLQWQGIVSKSFSVAEYRRQRFGEKLDPSYYDPTNHELYKLRLELAHYALDKMIDWLKEEGGQVGIFDAANITLSRRQMVQHKLASNGIHVIFLEVICDQPETILENFKNGAKYSPEYYGMDLNAALEDMKSRLSFYEPYYEPVGTSVSEELLHYIKVTNVSESIITNRIYGYLPTKIAHYLMNINPTTKHILFLCEAALGVGHGRSESDASSVDTDFAQDDTNDIMVQRVCSVLLDCIKKGSFNYSEAFSVWSGPSPRTIRLASLVKDCMDKHHKIGSIDYSNPIVKSQLSRLELSAFEKKNLDQIRLHYQKEYDKFINDPYYHRFPGGESYHDLAIRLENVLMELEGARSRVVLLVADISVLRCLYAYYTNIPSKDIPFLDLPANTLLALEPCAYGSIENRYELFSSGDSLFPYCSLKNCFRYTAS
jgi:broad specificity phosphatase PhoE